MGAHSKITGQKYLPVGINAESWTENMGISHEYHSAPRRRTRGGISGKLRLAGVIVAILLVAYAVTAILEKGTVEEDSTPQTGAGGIAQNILAPLPMQGEAASGSGSEGAADSSGTAQAVQLESFGPARQTDGAYTIKAYDASVIRQPACGQVDLSYFSDAAFLGDSLTVGFSDYQINLSGALICGYRSISPNTIVNRTTVTSPDRGEEVALDVLAANQPAEKHGRILFHLALGSLCMAFVAGCRPQMVLFAALCLPIFWQRYLREKRLFTKQGITEAVAFVLPVVLVWYIFTELGSIAENAAALGAPVPESLLKLLAVGKSAAENRKD